MDIKETVRKYWWVALLLALLFGGSLYFVLGVGDRSVTSNVSTDGSEA